MDHNYCHLPLYDRSRHGTASAHTSSSAHNSANTITASSEVVFCDGDFATFASASTGGSRFPLVRNGFYGLGGVALGQFAGVSGEAENISRRLGARMACSEMDPSDVGRAAIMTAAMTCAASESPTRATGGVSYRDVAVIGGGGGGGAPSRSRPGARSLAPSFSVDGCGGLPGDDASSSAGTLDSPDTDASGMSLEVPRRNLTDAFEKMYVDVEPQEFGSSGGGGPRRGAGEVDPAEVAEEGKENVERTRDGGEGGDMAGSSPGTDSAVTPAAKKEAEEDGSKESAISPTGVDELDMEGATAAPRQGVPLQLARQASREVKDSRGTADALPSNACAHQSRLEPDTTPGGQGTASLRNGAWRSSDPSKHTFALPETLALDLRTPVVARVSFYSVVHDINKEATEMAANDHSNFNRRKISSPLPLGVLEPPKDEKGDPIVVAVNGYPRSSPSEHSASVYDPKAGPGGSFACCALIDEEHWLLEAVSSRSADEVADGHRRGGPCPAAFAKAIGEQEAGEGLPQQSDWVSNQSGGTQQGQSANPLLSLEGSRTQLWKPSRSWWEAKSGKNPWIEPSSHNKRWRYLWPLIHYHKFLAKCIKKLKRNMVDVKTSPSPIVVFLREEVCSVSDHLALTSKFTSEEWMAALANFRGWTDDQPDSESNLRALVGSTRLRPVHKPGDVDSPLLRDQIDEQFLRVMVAARKHMANGGNQDSRGGNSGGQSRKNGGGGRPPMQHHQQRPQQPVQPFSNGPGGIPPPEYWQYHHAPPHSYLPPFHSMGEAPYGHGYPPSHSGQHLPTMDSMGGGGIGVPVGPHPNKKSQKQRRKLKDKSAVATKGNWDQSLDWGMGVGMNGMYSHPPLPHHLYGQDPNGDYSMYGGSGDQGHYWNHQSAGPYTRQDYCNHVSYPHYETHGHGGFHPGPGYQGGHYTYTWSDHDGSQSSEPSINGGNADPCGGVSPVFGTPNLHPHQQPPLSTDGAAQTPDKGGLVGDPMPLPSPFWGHLDQSTLAMTGLGSPLGGSEAANLTPGPKSAVDVNGGKAAVGGGTGKTPGGGRRKDNLQGGFGGGVTGAGMTTAPPLINPYCAAGPRHGYAPPSPATQFLMSPQANSARAVAYNSFGDVGGGMAVPLSPYPGADGGCEGGGKAMPVPVRPVHQENHEATE